MAELDTSLIKDWGFNALAITFFGVVLYSLLRTSAPKNATIAGILAVFCALMGNPDRFETMKFSPLTGFEAKTRELTQTIDDAKEAIRQIRELAVVTAEALIDLRVNSHALLVGVPGRDEFREQDEFKARVIEALKKMRLPQDKLTEVSQSDRNAVMTFYAYAAFRFGRDALPQSEWTEIDNAYNTEAAKQPLSPDQCQALLDSFHIDTAKFAEYLDDYRYYVKTGEQRRPEVWAHRERWGFGLRP
jgi:hypothetical protein